MIHILRNSRNASDPFICAVQVLKQISKSVEFLFFFSIIYGLLIVDELRTSSGPHPTSGFPASPSKPLHIPNSDP